MANKQNLTFAFDDKASTDTTVPIDNANGSD
jgi:hypothetical protein